LEGTRVLVTEIVLFWESLVDTPQGAVRVRSSAGLQVQQADKASMVAAIKVHWKEEWLKRPMSWSLDTGAPFEVCWRRRPIRLCAFITAADRGLTMD